MAQSFPINFPILAICHGTSVCIVTRRISRSLVLSLPSLVYKIDLSSLPYTISAPSFLPSTPLAIE